MPVYEYCALDERGRTKRGIISAQSTKLAYEKLRSMGLYPTSLNPTGEEEKEGKRRKGRSLGFIVRSSASQEMVYSMRQLATLLSAGFPIDRALDATVEQIKNEYLKKCMFQIYESIKEGKSFASAISAFPHLFSSTIQAMVVAGESSGTLDIVLEEVANLLEEQASFRRRLQSSIAYPIFVLVVGVAVIVFLLMFVVPRVTLIFSEMNQTLPFPTLVLIAISNFIKTWWWALLLGALVSIAGFKRSLRIKRVKKRVDAALLKFPLVGGLIKDIILARFARILGTLLKNGVPLLTGLEIVKNITSNVIIREAIERITSCVGEGKDMVIPMKDTGVFPTPMIQMVAAGIESGSLDRLLIKFSENMEREVSARLAVMVSLVEPVLILALGIVVGFVVVAILLPILEMSQLVR